MREVCARVCKRESANVAHTPSSMTTLCGGEEMGSWEVEQQEVGGVCECVCVYVCVVAGGLVKACCRHLYKHTHTHIIFHTQTSLHIHTKILT